MSTLDQMQAFMAVVEEGSFTAAAMQFDISPAAMCKKISQLEKSINTRLLIRTPRLITVTDIGKKYYFQCQKVLHEYKLSNLLLEDINSNLNGTVNIVCIREVAQKIIYPTMAIFLERYPHIVTSVSLKKEPTDITLNHFDIAIGYESSKIFSDWCCRKLNEILIHYPNIKPTPLKIKAYMDFFLQNCN